MGKVRLSTSVILLLLFSGALSAKADSVSDEAAKHLPEQIGNFKAKGAAIPEKAAQMPGLFEGSVVRTYLAGDGASYNVQLQVATNDAAAFALLTHARLYFGQSPGREWKLAFDEVGTASFAKGGAIFFYKGNVFACVTAAAGDSDERARELAREIAEPLSTGEGEIPVLVKHLPNWETTSKTAIYSVSLEQLKATVVMADRPANLDGQSKAQPVLDVVNFDGGTEAVTADYGQAKLVIIEFTTPQFSIDNDSRIWTRIAELKSQGLPTPNAYRRVGNYSVFVFNSLDEKTANGLVDQVKYEQVVQWLGDDPHLADRLQKYFTQTSAGVFIAVLKSSGLSLVLCLGIGGLVGTLLFRHRRAQRAAAFSDAGGSTRLNLDELTGPTSKQRLLTTSEGSHNDPAS